MAAFALAAAGTAAALVGLGSSGDALPERVASERPAGIPISDRTAAVSPVALEPLAPVPVALPAPGARIEPAVPSGMPVGVDAAPAPRTFAKAGATASPTTPAASATQTAPSPQPRTDTLAQNAARAPRPGASKPRTGKGREDPDIDLVAAIIARLDRRGSDPHGPARPAAQGSPASTGTAARLRRCGAGSDPVEARRCRGRACDGHRGQVDPCPASRAPKTSRREGAVNAEGG